VTKIIHVADGREVAVDRWGDPAGMPVFLLHGTPGSRRGPRPRPSVLHRLGINLICYDRPGYGRSSRHRGRTVADAAADVCAIADSLGVDQFCVVGRSGGGPHALACAAQLTPRVLSAAILVGIAPSDAQGLHWDAGMTESNVSEYTRDNPAAVAHDLSMRAEQIGNDPESMIEFLFPELTAPDRRVVGDVAIRRQLIDTYAEACSNGPHGWIDDVLAFRCPWGFDLSAIQAPVIFWHGSEDVFSPVAHTYWLAERIPSAVVEVKVQPNAAHFNAVEVLPSILAKVLEAAAQDGRGSSVPSSRRPSGDVPIFA
jgi:pimeloyl-ACP methyl ester carboxylesterase